MEGSVSALDLARRRREALLAANIVFDFRPLYGDTTLADALRDLAVRATRARTRSSCA